jgi:hypothetical protein
MMYEIDDERNKEQQRIKPSNARTNARVRQEEQFGRDKKNMLPMLTSSREQNNGGHGD